MANIADQFPIYDITKKGLIIGDNQISITACFELELPIVFTLGVDEYKDLVEDFRKFLELVGENTLVHLQTFYHKELFSFGNVDDDIMSKKDEFVERAYQYHFNERPYLKAKRYMYVSKLPDEQGSSATKILVDKEFAKTDDEAFLDNIINSASILKKHNVFLRHIPQDELVSSKSPIVRYLTLSDANIEEMKDIDFSDNKVFVGNKELRIFSIHEGDQFPTTSVQYCKIKNGLPVSSLFGFSYDLGIPHILNQYIYIGNQKKLKMDLEKKLGTLNSFNFKGANDNGVTDIVTFKEKLDNFGANGVYFHTNIMCFDATHKEIEERVNTAFAESSFKKKEVTLLRKDIFWSGIAGNGSRLVSQKSSLMEILMDLEACSYLCLEQNYEDGISSHGKGVRLCDRIYGIPFEVDVYGEPKRKGWIKNENTIVLAGSGGGKSFTMNLFFLNDYRQGNHIFVIDASFSYKLQCAMHGGVYLTYDEKSKITFNPFYIDWLKEPLAKQIFGSADEKKYSNDFQVTDDESADATSKIEAYKDYLENKISVLMGILASMTKNENEETSKFEKTMFRTVLFNYFKDRCLNNKIDDCKFDDFYDFFLEFVPKFLEENKLGKEDFNFHTFKTMLDTFHSEKGSLGYLLNATDEKIKNIDKERFVVIDVSRIRGNTDLFPIVSALAMDLYNQKVAKLPIGVKKILCIDEAWQAISSPDMAVFMKTQVKVIRKYGGRTVFITQEPDDFIASEIIKESIINNSAVKIYLDMGEFKQKFEPIKRMLAISDNNEMKIKSLNQANRKDSFYREVCICWESYGQVYAVETPKELKAIFETDPDEVAKILPQYEKYGVELTATNYANR